MTKRGLSHRDISHRDISHRDTSHRDTTQRVSWTPFAIAWRISALLGATLLLLYEARLWRECTPAITQQLARARAIALDARCDERTPEHAAWREHLDCATPRRQLAAGRLHLVATCMLARHPFAAYATLLSPLVWPRFDAAHELAIVAAAAAAVLWLLSSCLSPLLLYWREERMHSHFRQELVEMRRSLKQVAGKHQRSDRNDRNDRNDNLGRLDWNAAADYLQQQMRHGYDSAPYERQRQERHERQEHRYRTASTAPWNLVLRSDNRPSEQRFEEL